MKNSNQKRIFLAILFLITLSGNVYSQNNEYESDKIAIINFLTKYCSFSDSNPTRQGEADSINFLLIKILEKQADNVPDLISQTLHSLYSNSISEFEDSPDIYRMRIRRYMCFIALALLSDEYRYPTFLEDASSCLRQFEKESLNDKIPEKWLIINMVELYKILNRNHTIPKKELKSIAMSFQNDLKNRQEHIHNEHFIMEYDKILLKFINY
jgi:hypothetical protein